jgi:hypothetical protein
MILPGMSGFQPSPTYDSRLHPSATPGQPPPCPAVDPDLSLPTEFTEKLVAYENTDFVDLADVTLEFLNQGGSPEILIQAIEAVDPQLIDQQDFTNDGQAELLLKTTYLSVLGCKPDGSAKYAVFGKFIDYGFITTPRINTLQDLNQDGFPELVLTSRSGGWGASVFLQVIQWDGLSLRNMFKSSSAYPYRTVAATACGYYEQPDVCGVEFEAGTLELEDLDRNGTIEIIVHSDLPGHPELLAHGPWRGGKDIFTWNGEAYVLLRSEIDPPEYRFQAVHDADQAALLGEYDEALRLYQEAIFSDQLAGWSPELNQQQIDLMAFLYSTDPTPTPYPAPTEEYYHLAAYARFRILLLHALRGYTTEAKAIYGTLQNEFPEGQPGYESALLGQYFWQAFQATQDVGQACNQALESMGEQTDEIIYWLSGYHGWQSPSYQPVDLCPFGQTGTR